MPANTRTKNFLIAPAAFGHPLPHTLHSYSERAYLTYRIDSVSMFMPSKHNSPPYFGVFGTGLWLSPYAIRDGARLNHLSNRS